MVKASHIALSAAFLVLGVPAEAGWRSPIIGAKVILPSTFVPQAWVVLGPLPAVPIPSARTPNVVSTPDAQPVWALPLVDRTPTALEKAADIAPSLQDAILRIEPIYDPTRLEGPDAPPTMAISAGTASMDNVFADRWRRADTDPTVDAKTDYLATIWSADGGPLPCDAFTKRRQHGFGEPALTALGDEDCDALKRQQARGLDEDAPSPVIAGAADVPVFAAPLPGSRLSSQDFWAARKARVLAIQAHLQRKWQADAVRPTEVGSR